MNDNYGMEKKLVWGCIADDFTGASDAASFFAKGGLSTILYSGMPKQEFRRGDCQVIVIALKTRTQETAAAIEETLQAARWLKKQGVPRLYIKYCSTFDSTPKGNIGPVMDALLEEYQIPYTILCPALPVNGRAVRQGHLYVNGVPLHESPMKHHPLTPMWDSSIAGLMAPQSRYSCINVTEEQYSSPNESIWMTIEGYGKTHRHFYVVPDYEKEEDAERIAGLFADLPLLSGGSGIIEALSRRTAAGNPDRNAGHVRPKLHARWQGGGIDDGGADGNGGNTGDGDKAGDDICSRTGNLEDPGLILAGSCSEMTRKQISYAVSHGLAAEKIRPLDLLNGTQTREELWDFIEQHKNEELLLYSSDSPEQVRQIQSAGKERIAALLEEVTASLAQKAVEAGYKRIIVAGGETSGAVTKALGFDSYLIGESAAPGVPVMIPEKQRDLRLVLKSGNFGQEDFFLKALKLTKNHCFEAGDREDLSL